MHTISPTATEKNWKCFFWCVCVCVCVWVWKRKRDRECQMWVCACLCHEMYLKLRSYSNTNQESKADRDWSTRTGPCAAPRSTQDLRPHISISAHPSQQEKERGCRCEPRSGTHAGLQAVRNRLGQELKNSLPLPPGTTKGAHQRLH